MTRAIALIPSRLDSRRFPGKALHLLEGLPVIVHVAKRAQLSNLIDEVYVCTDSVEIQSVCEKNNINVFFRDEKFHNGTERIASEAYRFPGSIIIDVQGDEPLIDPGNIDKVVSFTRDNISSVEIVIPTISYPYDAPSSIVRVISSTSGRVLYLTRSVCPYPFANKPLICNKHLSVIGFSPGSLEHFIRLPISALESIEGVELLRAVENDMRVFSLPLYGDSISIDVPDDLAIAQVKMSADKIRLMYP